MMDNQLQLPSDGQLIVAARDGMGQAWNELLRRHEEAVTGAAKARSSRRAKKLAQHALDRLHGSISEGEGPADGDPAARAFRTRALATLTGGFFGPGIEDDFDDADADPAELHSIARAFATLPEPWQTALWHHAVELQPSAEVATLLGRTANEASAVVQRAETGLFEAFLLDQVESQAEIESLAGRPFDRSVAIAPRLDPACAAILPLLGGSLRATLSAHQQRVVEDHLHNRTNGGGSAPGCAACCHRLALSAELPALLPAAIVPGITGLTVERYRAAVGVRPQPVGAVSVENRRQERARALAIVGALAALVLAVVAAVVLIRDPFDGVATPVTSQNDGPATSATSPASTEAVDDSTATTSTEVDIRPAVQGPENRLEFVFAPGFRAAGFAPATPELSVEFSSPAPVFAGGTATVDVAITNSDGQPAVTNFTINVPRGVLLDQLVEGDGECADPDDDSAYCNITIEPNATATLALRFTLTSSVVGRFIVESNSAAETLEVQIFAVPRLVYSSVGHGDIVMIGNTLMSCLEADAVCLDAVNGVGESVNRWDLPTEFIGANAALGFENSSVATLDTGAGSVEAAYLFWSGDLKERTEEVPDDGSKEVVRMLVPNSAEPFDVPAGRVRLGDVDATQYFGFADVTDIVKFAGPGDYTVGNVQTVEVQGSYAGWSLVVVTKDAALPRRELVVTSPFTWFSPEDTYLSSLPVPAGSGQTALVDVLAFEGELGFTPEQLVLGGVALGEEGAFDSSIVGARVPSFVNNFGIDIDAYALSIDAPDGNLPIEATSGKDGIRLAVLALAVDLE